MKQKYAITVADMELSIISDASPDEVENIVGMLDRRMRDINLKSPRCTKNEAAVLCALSYCSERIAMQEAFKKVEKDAFRYADENAKLKKTIETMQEEIDNLRKDASVMRSILDRAAAQQTETVQEKPKYVPKPFGTVKKADVPVEEPAEVEAPAAKPVAAPVAEVPAEEPVKETAAEAPVEETAEETSEDAKKSAKKDSKSHVGNMFDLLFSDI